MKFNQIIKNNIKQHHFPSTKKFNSENNDEANFRTWNPFQNGLSAAILCGLEIIPINKKSSLLYVGQLEPSVSLNLLDLVENNKKIFIYSKKPNQFSNKENLIQITNFNLIKNQKFSVIYIENLEYSYELITNITKSSLENLGYLIIKFSTLSQNPKIFFEKMSKQFELLQEINIESFSKNNFLIIFKSRN